MTKDELYSKIAEMLPVENTDSKPFRILLSDSLKTYLSYIIGCPVLCSNINSLV